MNEHRHDPELYEVLPPSIFEELIDNAQNQLERLTRVSELLKDGDMLCYHVENTREHLGVLIAGWRGDLEVAQHWL